MLSKIEWKATVSEIAVSTCNNIGKEYEVRAIALPEIRHVLQSDIKIMLLAKRHRPVKYNQRL